MFEYYTEQVVIEDAMGNSNTYRLVPLKGKDLSKLYKIMKGFGKDIEKDENGKPKDVPIESIDEELMGDLHDLAFKTMRDSYPKEDPDEIDKWVSQNLVYLVEPLVKVNVGREEVNSDARTE